MFSLPTFGIGTTKQADLIIFCSSAETKYNFFTLEMGVPKFYSWLREKNRQYRGIIQRSVPSIVSSLSLDMNGLLHQVAQLVFSYGSSYDEARMKVLETSTEDELYQDFFATLSTAIVDMITQVAPKDTLILAVDGVAPLAKINQQRTRRFTSSPSPYFNSNVISPGTDFMYRVDEFLRDFISKNNSMLPAQVIYSSHMVPGEAEQKIFDFFRGKKLDGAHCVSGLDADLVVLSMGVSANMFIIRQDLSDVVSVSNLKAYLSKVMLSETAIPDFMLLSFLLGNDFLPASPAMEDLPTAIDNLLRCYEKVGLPLYSQGKVDYAALQKVLSLYPEEDMLLRESTRTAKPPNFLVSSVTYRTVISSGKRATIKKLDYAAFSSSWYRLALGPRSMEEVAERLLGKKPFAVTRERIEAMCQNYLSGIQWIWNYYMGLQDLDLAWYYAYHHAPTIRDLSSQAMQERKEPAPALADYYFNVPQQLTAIMPLSSLAIIPEEMQKLPFTNLADEFPTQVITEEKSTGASWHRTVLLPFLDRVRLIKNTPAFSEEAKEYYAPQNEIILTRSVRQNVTSQPARRGRGRGRKLPREVSYPGREKTWRKKERLI